MSTHPGAPHGDAHVPSRRDRLRPLELVGFAGILAVFAGVVVLFASRDLTLALVTLGGVFVIVTVTVALIGLGGTPSAEDETARKDLRQPGDTNDWH